MLNLFLPTRRASANTAQGPLSDFWYSLVGKPTASRINVNEHTAMTYSAVWAATRLLAGTSAWLPLNLHKTEGGKREIAYDDPRQRMVHDRPNRMISSMMFRSAGFAQQINGGNFYAEIVRDVKTDKPIAMFAITPTKIRAVINEETDELYYMLRRADGSEGAVPAADILHVPSMMSDDGICGKGVISNARESIGFGIVTERYGAAYFGKGGIPRIAITHPQKLSPEARAAFRQEWSDIYGGADGSRMALLQEGAGVTPISINNEDSQFLVTRQHNIEEIARWYGIPPHMLQHLLRSTFNNVEQLGIDFVTFSLMPWLKLWEQELWFKLLTPKEQETHSFRFNVNGLLRGDSAARREWYRTMVTLGVFSRNEVRELEEMNPVEGGDVHLIQGAMVAIGDDGVPMLPTAGDAVDVNELDDEVDNETNDTTDTEEETDTEPTDGMSSPESSAPTVSAMDAARAVLSDSLSRMAFKEMQAATRAANKPSEFQTWLEEFYGSHAEKLGEAVKAAALCMKAAGVNQSREAIVGKWCGESRSVLDACLDVPQATFATVVKNRVADWASTRVEAFVVEVSGQNQSAA